MTRTRRTLAALAMAAVAVAATPASTEYQPTVTSLYAHRNQCVDSGDFMWMNENPSDGQDEGSGCGYLLASGFEVLEAAGQDVPGNEFTTFDVDPAIIDGTRDLEGEIGYSTDLGGGQVETYVKITARIDGKTVTLGEDTITTIVTPNQFDYAVPFSFDLDDELTGGEVTQVTLYFETTGVIFRADFVRTQGATFLDVPTLEEVEAAA